MLMIASAEVVISLETGRHDHEIDRHNPSDSFGFFYLQSRIACRQSGVCPRTNFVDPPNIENVALVPSTTFNVSVKVNNIPASPGLAGV
jgi:hypothetical protein